MNNPTHQTVMVIPIEEPSPNQGSRNHTINQTQSNPEGVPYRVQLSPETSIKHGIPNTSTQPLVIRSDQLVQTDQSIPVSVSEAGPTHVLILQDPPHSQSLNISNTAEDNQVAYISRDQLRSLLQTYSWPQANPPHVLNPDQDRPSKDEENPIETSKPNPQEVIAGMVPPPPPATAERSAKKGPGGQLANTAANLANLLPTGTVLAFQALTPSLSNSGKCQSMNKILVASTVACCAIACFLSSFTDSLVEDGKLYYGFVTFKGLCVVNAEREEIISKELTEDKRYKVSGRDFVHALGSLLVFVIFAFSSTDVLNCFFTGAAEEDYSVIIYLPLLAGILSSLLFTVFPTKRKGIGYTTLSR